MIRLALPGLCLLLLLGCVNGEKGEEIALKQGDTYTIMLDENPTTGYQWRIYLIDLRVISTETNEFIPPVIKDGKVGVPGQRKIVIKGERVGRGELELQYIRSWNTKPEDKKLYTFRIYPE